jgi:hypothetical protein
VACRLRRCHVETLSRVLRPPGKGQSIDWPTDNPSSAAPTGASTETCAGEPSISWGYTSRRRRSALLVVSTQMTSLPILTTFAGTSDGARTSARNSSDSSWSATEDSVASGEASSAFEPLAIALGKDQGWGC